MILRAAVAWLALMAFGIANGALREAVLAPRLGPGVAHLASTLILCVLIVLASWLLIGWLHPVTLSDALRVSGLWLVMTLVFEFGFGRLVAGRSWTELLADYDLLRARVWVLVLVTIALAPPFTARARAACSCLPRRHECHPRGARVVRRADGVARVRAGRLSSTLL